MSPDVKGIAEPQGIPRVPPPWALRGDIYMFSFWTRAADASLAPTSLAYSPLEARSDFASAHTSRPVGGLGMVQILRYRDSPVGAYDEMLVVPGSFDWARRDASGRQRRGRNPKITRIYVSQKHACYNGRLNWNAPKHLARFEWTQGQDGSTGVRVFPHDTGGDPREAQPDDVPFFSASFRPLRYAPRFPLATGWMGYLGFDSTLVMPPLPAGQGSQGELPGTEAWCSLATKQYCARTALGWFDIAQSQGCDNFWPGLGRWQLGVMMQDAEVVFEKPVETWEDAAALEMRARL